MERKPLANKASPRVAFLGHGVSDPLEPSELATGPLQLPPTGTVGSVCSPSSWLPPKWIGPPWFPGGRHGQHVAVLNCPESSPLPLAHGNARQKASRCRVLECPLV